MPAAPASIIALINSKTLSGPPKPGFRIGHDGEKPIDLRVAFGVRDLVRALQRLVDPFHYRGDAVRRIEALVGIHLSREIGVGRDLPAAEVDRLQTGARLLHRLVAGERTERRDEGLGVEQVPELFRAAPGEGVLRDDAALQTLDVA